MPATLVTAPPAGTTPPAPPAGDTGAPPTPPPADSGTPPGDAAGAGETPPGSTTPPADGAPETPPAGEVQYDLKLPKDSVLDASAVERTVAYARERGLSPEHAQAALELAASEAAALQAAADEQYLQVVNGWKEKTLQDPALGATPEARLATIQKGYAVLEAFKQKHPDQAGELVELLESEGYGNHPAVARFFGWLGRSSGERPIVHGSPTAPAVDVAKKIYPTMN